MGNYQLVIVHEGEPLRATEIERRVREAIGRILPDDSVLERRATVAEALGTHTSAAVVYLGSTAAAVSVRVASELIAAREAAVPVLPLVPAGADIRLVIPESIKHLNAIEDRDSREPAMTILRFLGVADSDRRLFLSYRRAETSPLALQLRRTLSERSYDVFLDRFSVPPGDDFQQRINIELADKAFVAVLESESAVGSDWVQHEVTYALSHLIGVLALTMPGVSTSQQFEVIDDAFRMRLKDDDFESGAGAGQLTSSALDRVLKEVEIRYAREMRRRRLHLLASSNDFLRQAGYDRMPIDDWSTLASRASDRLVVSVTPVAPAPRALRHADLARRRVEAVLGQQSIRLAYVVHDAPESDPDARAIAEWIVADRPLAMSTIADFPGALE